MQVGHTSLHIKRGEGFDANDGSPDEEARRGVGNRVGGRIRALVGFSSVPVACDSLNEIRSVQD